MKFLVTLVKEESTQELERSLQGKGYRVTTVRGSEAKESGRRDFLLIPLEEGQQVADIERLITASGHQATSFTMEVEERSKFK